ncbi:unnamed protein product [Rodentolepis nana]|uniref:ELM2 domain-containing protein n=1 Tax=Rodentolepis nana TaxID=102285 RepID=A0A0R3TEJ2_RODNA|nr:unnamed protein product [Rodentolepis nana]
MMSVNGPSAPQDALAISNDIYGVNYSQVHEVQFLSEEDEYSMVHDIPPPNPVRKSYEGAIRYASLLWDKTAKSVRSSKNKEEKSPCEAPTLPPKEDEMTTPLIGVSDEKLVGRPSFLDRPSRNLYERSKEESLEEERSPLPVKDFNSNQKSK